MVRRANESSLLTHSTFTTLGLPPLILSALDKAGFDTPTAIQAKSIPSQLQGRDILGIAQTGSGKTAAFGLPILAGIAELKGRPNPMTTRALILAPTRELAVQIEEVLQKLSVGMRLQTVLVLGGVSRNAQIQKIARGVDVVIATPGRLQDLMEDRKIKLNETRWLVLDEADRMLDMGFILPVKKIAAAIGPRRQTALFSATMAKEIAELAKGLLNDPVRVEAQAPATTVVTIDQRVILSGSKQKRDELNKLLADPALERVIIFSRTKHGADRVTKNLAIDGHEAAAIHGNKSQNARQAALKGFASGKVRILVATDIAARGIDVPNITHVINYELPDDAENYVHRIGRTARNGASGFAITLCDGTERGKLRDVERLIRKTLPTTGEIKQAEHTAPAERKPHRGQGPRPEGARTNPQRPQRNAGRHFSGAKKAAISEARGETKPQQRKPAPKREAAPAGAPASNSWWEKPTGAGNAGAAKGRPQQRRGGGQQRQRAEA
ncbi:MAG: DEAD/DEAH box helicase [Hyphomicrobiales bacterium]|nr:MAG: DEAD/DEAH box helicase [Hyphomicrobiales bacterium]